MSFRLTYGTMYNPPEALHEGFEGALARVSEQLGACHPLYINGENRAPTQYAERYAPFDTTLHLGSFASATDDEADAAMHAAQKAFPGWRNTSVSERVRLIRRVGDLLEQRVYDLGATLVLEVGKNRMEGLGEAQEAVDFFHQYADDFESHNGYTHVLPDDPIEGVTSHNASVMRPYGAWVVIVPFNYPLALAAGPVAAALVTGNTVVLKGSSETPWAARMLADCIHDAGLPPGVFNYLSGSSREAGDVLARHPLTAGITFTGSVPVGRHLVKLMSDGDWLRPCIAEMGGKNPCIVTEHANLEAAAVGIVRSAYGMTGQKCSALSRLYVHEDVADALIERVIDQMKAISVGDPRRREHWTGPVVNATAYAKYQQYVDELQHGGATILAGGKQIGKDSDGPAELSQGYFVEPTLAEVPLEHPLWPQELFVPILMLHRCKDRDDAMRQANSTTMGLAAGFYGGDDEVAWFHDHIEAGVTYANRAQGATTGSWPGYQPFVGWKASSSTGNAIASFYYLAQYMREQSRTVVE
jgi:1-pyrroline-5-carboxylate dehydrogenase